MLEAEEVCLFTTGRASRGHRSRLPLPVSALAASTFWPSCEFATTAPPVSASTHPSRSHPVAVSRLHLLETAEHTSRWCQSHRARPCSRSPIDLCPRSPSSAFAVRTSQSRTHAWAQCHPYWVCALVPFRRTQTVAVQEQRIEDVWEETEANLC